MGEQDSSATIEFANLPRLLRGDELLVLNNTRVIPARLFAHREGVSAQIAEGGKEAKLGCFRRASRCVWFGIYGTTTGKLSCGRGEKFESARG